MLTAVLYNLFSRLHASFGFGGSSPSSVSTSVMVKRQAEEVGKRAQDKLRAQGNYKHKTCA